VRDKIFQWELIGTVVIFLLGSGFHFLFQSLGNNPVAGVFFPVNESVFEHLKLTLWPTLLWAVFSYGFIKSSVNNFITAKACAVLVMPLLTVALFYAYTSFIEDNVIADILIFLVAVASGQYVNYLFLKSSQLPKWLSGVSACMILVLAIIYTIFTFFPPYTSFFMDSNTGNYGIP